MTLCVANNTDLTPYISKKSYKVNSKPQYESWQDGNFVEHRVIVRQRVEGSFDIGALDFQAFLDIWDGAVHDGIVTMGVFVQDQNKIKAIDAYYDFTGKKHYERVDGGYFDVVTVSFTER